MEDCLFCSIAAGKIPSNKVYEDDEVFAFRDIAPQAKTHVLLIPKKHIANWTDAAENESDALLAHMMRTAGKIAAELNLKESGYRVVSNCGPDARQSVPHLHFHILGGETLSEKMS